MPRLTIGAAATGVPERHHAAARGPYLDIATREGSCFPDKPRFMGYAARVMRGLIIDHARSQNAIKRVGEFQITSLKTELGENPVDAKELSAISDALDQLAKACGISGPEVFLRAFVRRGRRLGELVGTYRAAKVGKGAHLSPPEYSGGFASLVIDVQAQPQSVAGP